MEEYNIKNERLLDNGGIAVKTPRTNKWIICSILAACLTLIFAAGLTTYSASSDFRGLLAKVLHLDVEDTHYIGLSDSDNGVVLTVVSSHVCKGTAVVLLTFEKDDGQPFGNGMNPSINLYDKKGDKVFKSGMSGGIYTELSEDRKTLFCYYTCIFPSNFLEKAVTLKVDELSCNWSEVAGKTWPDELIRGNWCVSFELRDGKDNAVTVENYDKSKIVEMCGKKLQIDSVLMSDMLLIANTTTLSDSGMPVDFLSSVSTASGSYYGVYIWLTYADGSVSERKDCLLDQNGNIIAWFPETILMDEVTAIHIGEIIIGISE
ncbi:hypothetical protein DFR58_13631 [Anaerobacterium chartisolvens]|uniref:DUF4179 domain-containing protein n=1 Tax=Anaerobacterium chartisolvens TaxID=1297424 RepID=A0A369AJV6_9FIRM|nr:hypothetical protein [Anaerobacterium chartisolvens]RCX09355.1 hypothetical protein DFR58_13631 [Anaerobacterium chartisolvens]